MIVADSSVVVGALLWWHEDHESCRPVVEPCESLIGHVALETYSVLTRLPEDVRTDPHTAQGMIDAHFPGPVIVLTPRKMRSFLSELPRIGVSAGAVYDALVAATARDAGATLVTRDRRAMPTYAAVGVDVRLIA